MKRLSLTQKAQTPGICLGPCEVTDRHGRDETGVRSRRIHLHSLVRILAAGMLAFVVSPVSAQQAAAPGNESENSSAPPADTVETGADPRAQYPAFIVNSYISVSIGHIDYRFTNRQLEPGFKAGSIDIPHLAARIVLFGHHFNQYLSAEAVLARPGRWVSYRDVNGDGAGHSVWMNVGALTLKPTLPIGQRVSLFAQAGLSVVTRHGFQINDEPAVTSSVTASVILGGGVDYHVNPRWDLTADFLMVPASDRHRRPATRLFSGGFRYTLRPIPAARVAANRDTGALFPERLIQIEYSTNALGYGLNHLLSKQVPIFWGGNVHVARGFAVHYERNVYHSRRVLAFNLGVAGSAWRGRDDGHAFYTLAIYPLLRFTVIRTTPADLFVFYSVAGPSYISSSRIDGHDVGRGFTFQDFLGVGLFLGPSKRISAQLKITHYSNGNFLTNNAGVKVPATFSLGYSF